MLKMLKFVTSNSDKVREASDILECSLDQVSGLNIDEIQASDIKQIVTHKAQQAFDELRCPVLVEDSGLSFTAWNGLPGPLIKYSWPHKSFLSSYCALYFFLTLIAPYFSTIRQVNQ